MASLLYPDVVFPPSFEKYLWSAYFRLKAVWDAGDRTIKKRHPTQPSWSLTFYWEKVTVKK